MKTWVCCLLLAVHIVHAIVVAQAVVVQAVVVQAVVIVVVMNVLRVQHVRVLNFGWDESASRGGLHYIDEGEGASKFAIIFKEWCVTGW